MSAPRVKDSREPNDVIEPRLSEFVCSWGFLWRVAKKRECWCVGFVADPTRTPRSPSLNVEGEDMRGRDGAAVMTPAMLALKAAERWKKAYYREEEGWWGRTMRGVFCLSSNSEKTYRALVALGSAPTPEQVDEVIGNSSWTDTDCDQCGSSREPVVTVGDEEDFDSSTSTLCRGCVEAALRALDRA